MVDLHIHTDCSDGTDSVEDLIDKVIGRDIDTFAITDHDTAEAIRKIIANESLKNKIKNNGLTLIPGVEWSCIYNGYKMHILSYDIDPNSEEVLTLEKMAEDLVNAKSAENIQKCLDAGYVFSEKSWQKLRTKKNLRKIDVADCLVDDGYFSDYREVFKKVLPKTKRDAEFRLDARLVIETLSRAGAKLVWAHSIGGIDEKKITFEEVEWLTSEMVGFGLSGLECYYSLYTEEEIQKLVALANKLGIFITCGSDYHGKHKTVELGEFSCDGKVKVPFEKLRILGTLNNNKIGADYGNILHSGFTF